MLDSLNKLFEHIELSWIDSKTDIENSNEFLELISIFPNLKKIIQDAREKNKDELQRTIRHIFRSYKIFFLMVNEEFYHETLSQESITILQKKVLKQHSHNQLIIPILLMYHDIGRYIDNKKHPYHSYNLISSMDLLEPFELSEIEKLLIRKLIQYHLLIATIYTGESTFYGIYSLFNDLEFIKLLSYQNTVNRFVDLLEIFTYIDILGYYYTKIFDHYIKYYEEINSKLKIILKLWSKKESALLNAKEYSQEWLEWRLAGALRIFQFVETKPHLTKEFYYQKLEESIKDTNIKLFNQFDWDLLKKKYLVHSYKIQLRYSLAFLMILAFGSFQRMGLKINTGVSYKLIFFWTLLSKEIESRSKNNSNALWNIFLIGMPHWSEINQIFIDKINEEKIELIIHSGTHEFDEDKEEFNFFLNFKQILE
ncbi:MAG: hypothetical protein JSV62_12915 [Promethearchaeota archaeon]|nr:MAG: hypothetical protein JSV62_12915 [Candidatus Lokiarchaeota archaeon]